MKSNIDLLKNIIINRLDNKNLINRYSKNSMKNCIVNKANINDLGTFVLQGICVVEKMIILSCYDFCKKNNSKLIILDEKGNFLSECIIDTKSHVGGICYDDTNKIIWVTDNNGTVSGYNKDDVFKNNKANSKYSKIKLVDNFKNIYGQNAIAFITYYKNQIYIGNYNYKNESFIKVYNILKNGKISLKPKKTIKSSYFIQGITFVNIKQKEYLLISSSIGYTSSNIKIYEYNDEVDDLNKLKYDECILPRMLEQIYYDKEKLYMVYESNAKKFKKLIKKNDISIIDIKSLLNKKGVF